MKKICIVIPAYNEEKIIGKTLQSYGEFFLELKKKKIIDFEILIVINNTKDNTEKVVKLYAEKFREIRYLNFVRGGKGFAIIEGFKDAIKRDNDYIGFVDADMATGPLAFYELVQNIPGYDGVIASRYVKGAIVRPKQSIIRIFASRLFNFVIRSLFLFPYKDTQCGAKVFRKEAIIKILPNLGLTEWAFDVDLLYNLHKYGFRIKENRTTWKDAIGSKVRVNKTGIQMLLASARLRLINSPFSMLAKPIKFVVKPLWKLVK